MIGTRTEINIVIVLQQSLFSLVVSDLVFIEIPGDPGIVVLFFAAMLSPTTKITEAFGV